jgi:hypothetical protein
MRRSIPGTTSELKSSLIIERHFKKDGVFFCLPGKWCQLLLKKTIPEKHVLNNGKKSHIILNDFLISKRKSG